MAEFCGESDAQEAPFTPCSDTHDGASVGTRSRAIKEEVRRFAEIQAEERIEALAETGELPIQCRAPGIYFVRIDGGAIKIGYTANLPNRIRTLKTATPERLRLLAYVEGDRADEGTYHRRFAAHRLRGEWFAPHPDILGEIERLSPTAAPGRAG